MKKIVIKENDANQRIDKYLKKLLCNAPSNFIYKMFRKKDIKINGKKVNEKYILQKDDILEMFLYDDKFNEFWRLRNDIPFVILNNLSLTALNLGYVTPTILYFLEKQKQLRILKINVGPQFSIRYLLSSIAGREFDFLAMNWLSKPDQRKLKDLLREDHVKAKVLFVNGKQVIPENDNKEKRLGQTESAGI